MNQGTNNTLLALLLTLSELEQPLTPAQQESLNKLGYMMDMEDMDWESDIQPNLLNIVQGHSVWNQQFTETKAKLDDLGGNLPQGIIPTPEEVERVLPSPSTADDRGHRPKGNPEEEESDNLKNCSRRVLMDNDPRGAAKKALANQGKKLSSS